MACAIQNARLLLVLSVINVYSFRIHKFHLRPMQRSSRRWVQLCMCTRAGRCAVHAFSIWACAGEERAQVGRFAWKRAPGSAHQRCGWQDVEMRSAASSVSEGVCMLHTPTSPGTTRASQGTHRVPFHACTWEGGTLHRAILGSARHDRAR